MATCALTEIRPAVVRPERGDQVRYVARQPILDLRGRVHGYELLFRAGPEARIPRRWQISYAHDAGQYDDVRPGEADGRAAGICKLHAGIADWDLVDVLPPSMTVLEILETVEPTPELVACLPKAEGSGFRAGAGRFCLEAGDSSRWWS